MSNDKNIGSFSASAFMISLICAKIFISAPSYYVKQSASAGWLEVFIRGIFEVIVLAVILRLLNGFEGMDIIDIAQSSFGSAGRVVIGVISCGVFLVSAAAVFRCYAELIRNCIINHITYEYMSIFILAAVIIAAYLGLKTQISLNGLIIPLLGIAVIIMLLVIYPLYSETNISPLLGWGFGKTLSNALLKNASYFEMGILLFIVPYLSTKKDVKKIAFTSIGLSIAVLSGITLCYQLAVPYQAASSFTLPMYQMTRMLKAGTFMQRLEPLIVFVWSGSLFIYIGTGIWFAGNTFKKTFSLSASRPMVFIFSEIVCLLALIPGSETSVERIYDFILSYAYVVYPLLPLVLLIAARAFKKRGVCR